MAYKAPFLPARGPVRSAQPQGVVGIDWSNPITKGLTSAILPGIRRFDAVTGLQLSTSSGTNTPAASVNGVVLQATASQSSIYATASPSQLTTSGSILWAGDLYASPSNDGCLGGITANNTNVAPYSTLELKRNNGGSGYTNEVYLAHSVGGSSANVLGANGGAPVGSGYCFIGTATSGSQILYVGKVGGASAVTSTAVAGSLTSSATSRLEVGDSLNARNPQSGCAVMMTWNRALSASEAASLSANPWQIFLPAKPQIPPAPSVAPRAPVSMRQSQILGMSGLPLAASVVLTKPRVVRTSQPQFATGIDWSNPITAGLQIAVTPRITAGQNSTLITSTIPVLAGSKGLEFYQTSGNGYLSFSSGGANYTGATLFGLVRIPVSSAQNPIVGFFNSSSGSTGFWLSQDTGTSSVKAISYLNGAYTQTGAVSYTAGSYAVLAATVGGGYIGLYVNGVFIGSASSKSFTSNLFMVGGQAVPGLGGGAPVAIPLAGFFNRALSASEIASLSANPWQIFAPNTNPIWGNV